MQVPGFRTWITFYLLSFVGLLWAAFLTTKGIMLWVSLTLIILVIGVNFLMVTTEIKRHAARQELQKSFSMNIDKKPFQQREQFRR
jgi:uncharacterized BrkB/YihY/UPF0761 family membrane protein